MLFNIKLTTILFIYLRSALILKKVIVWKYRNNSEIKTISKCEILYCVPQEKHSELEEINF